MTFVDDGFVLAARAHGETHAVVELLTESHGRCAGLVYGGQGRRMQPILQVGNRVRAEWKGRAGGLGFFSLELAAAHAAGLLHDRLGLAGLSAAAAVARACLPEGEPHPGCFRALAVLIDNLDAPNVWPALMARFELGLLAELGFGLSLDACAATGAREDLVYVSPKSASAVSAAAGAPYRDRLLPLPRFLREPGAPADLGEALAALGTTGHFLETRALHAVHQDLPDARRRVIELLAERLAAGAS